MYGPQKQKSPYFIYKPIDTYFQILSIALKGEKFLFWCHHFVSHDQNCWQESSHYHAYYLRPGLPTVFQVFSLRDTNLLVLWKYCFPAQNTATLVSDRLDMVIISPTCSWGNLHRAGFYKILQISYKQYLHSCRVVFLRFSFHVTFAQCSSFSWYRCIWSYQIFHSFPQVSFSLSSSWDTKSSIHFATFKYFSSGWKFLMLDHNPRIIWSIF